MISLGAKRDVCIQAQNAYDAYIKCNHCFFSFYPPGNTQCHGQRFWQIGTGTTSKSRLECVLSEKVEERHLLRRRHLPSLAHICRICG